MRLSGSGAVLAALAIVTTAPAQEPPRPREPLRGGVSVTDGPDWIKVYEKEDPFGGVPQVTGQRTGPEGSRCVPLNPRWRLVAEIAGTCYWYVPLVQPMPRGCVVPQDQIYIVQDQGGRCSPNPFNIWTALCDKCPNGRPAPPAPAPPPPPSLKGRAESMCAGGIQMSRERGTYAGEPRGYICRWDIATASFICCPRGGAWRDYLGPIPTPEQAANPNAGSAAPGGMNPCANPTPPPECSNARPGGVGTGGGNRPPPAPPSSPSGIADPTPLGSGMLRGALDCVEALKQLPTVIDSFLTQWTSMRMVDAERTLGLERGWMGSFARSMWQDLNRETRYLTDYQRGVLIAQRLCGYGLPAPPIALLGRIRVRKPVRQPVRTPVAFQPKPGDFGSPQKPLTPATLAEVLRNGDGANLAGYSVQLPPPNSGVLKTPIPGVVQLGNRIGGGTFGEVYEILGTPDAIKIITKMDPGGPASLAGQIQGNFRYGRAVVVPEIKGYRIGSGNDVSYVVMEDLRLRPDIKLRPDGSLAPPSLPAVKKGFTSLGDQGLIGADLKWDNMTELAPAQPFGQPRLLVFDTDLVATPQELWNAPPSGLQQMLQGNLQRQFQRADMIPEFWSDAYRKSAPQTMNALYEALRRTPVPKQPDP